MKNKSFRLEIVRIAVIAALQCALILGVAPLAFGPVQIRVASLMFALIWHPTLGLSAAIGCFLGGMLANFLGPYGLADLLIGGVLCGIIGYPFLYVSGRWAHRRQQVQPWLALSFLVESAWTAFIVGYVLLHLVFDLPVISVFTVWVGELVTKPIGNSLMWPIVKKVFPYTHGKG